MSTFRGSGPKAPAALIDAVMNAMADPDETAPLAVDRRGNPVLVDGWSIWERVPLVDDLDAHMQREVVPFAPDAVWDNAAAKPGNEIPFTRIFYVPEKSRNLAEIDTDVQTIMSELSAMFAEVRE